MLVLGSANLVADGISMGFSDFVSSSIERDMAARARLATERKITNRAQPQQMELLHTYQALGMEPEDARTVCWSSHFLHVFSSSTSEENLLLFSFHGKVFGIGITYDQCDF